MYPLPTRRRLLNALATALATFPLRSWSQADYPSRPITLVVPFAPGGIADATARAVAEELGRVLGKPVVVDNKPSAGSIVATQSVLASKPDGHTLLLISNGHAVSVGLFKKLPYDTLTDLMPVSTLGFFDLGIFVPQGSRFKSLRELLDHAKKHPGQLKIGTISVGSTQHLAAQLFQSVAGIDMLTVPYKGTPAVMVALRSGEIDVALEMLGPMMGQIQSSAVEVLAVTGERPNPALPRVPTVQQAGLEGYHVSSWNAIAVPSGTPMPVVLRLGDAIRSAVQSPAVRSRLEPMGMRLQSSDPGQAEALLKSEIRRWGEVIRSANLQPE